MLKGHTDKQISLPMFPFVFCDVTSRATAWLPGFSVVWRGGKGKKRGKSRTKDAKRIQRAADDISPDEGIYIYIYLYNRIIFNRAHLEWDAAPPLPQLHHAPHSRESHFSLLSSSTCENTKEIEREKKKKTNRTTMCATEPCCVKIRASESHLTIQTPLPTPLVPPSKKKKKGIKVKQAQALSANARPLASCPVSSSGGAALLMSLTHKKRPGDRKCHSSRKAVFEASCRTLKNYSLS